MRVRRVAADAGVVLDTAIRYVITRRPNVVDESLASQISQGDVVAAEHAIGVVIDLEAARAFRAAIKVNRDKDVGPD